MPRRPRADETGGRCHALNHGNARQTIFRKNADDEAFERILSDGLELDDFSLFSIQLMANHRHSVLRPNHDGAMSDFLRWITATHTMRYHANYHTSGQGHVYQGGFKSLPIQDDEHILMVCRYAERNALHAGLTKRAESWNRHKISSGFGNSHSTLRVENPRLGEPCDDDVDWELMLGKFLGGGGS